MNTIDDKLASLQPGARVRFRPSGVSGNRWWLVRVRNERYILATQQEPFAKKGQLIYTIIDTAWDITYNGVRPGVARSSLNTLGGGWDCTTDEQCQEALDALESGEFEFSHRRVLGVWDVEIAALS